MKVLELFGGIGACTQALKRLHVPLEIADYVEIDKYAVKSYNAINGTNFEPQDITKWDKDIEVDLIMHGSPCQDFSIAGKQAGADEGAKTRSSLMYETIRIVTKLKPKYVIWENVKNVLSQKHRHNFDAYLQKMSALGYENYYQVLNAKDYEIPQNRERIFTVSILNGGDFEFPRKKELKKLLKDVLEDEVDEKYYLSDELTKTLQSQLKDKNAVCLDLCQWRREGSPREYNEYAPCLGARDWKEPRCVQVGNISGGKWDKMHDVSRRVYTGEGLAPTVHTCGGGNTEPKVIVGAAMRGRYNQGKTEQHLEISDREYSNALTTAQKDSLVAESLFTETQKQMFTEDGNVKRYIGSDKVDEFRENQMADISFPNGYNKGKRVHNESPAINRTTTQTSFCYKDSHLRIRKLTPKECWRLMGFSDECFDKAQKVNSNTQLYKQAGNSIVVDVLVHIFRNLFLKQHRLYKKD